MHSFTNSSSIVALAGWRIKITSDALVQSDFVYGLYQVGLVSLLELWVGILAACLPTVAPLFLKYFGPIVSKFRSSSNKYKPRLPNEGVNTIGSGPKNRFRGYLNTLDTDTYVELGEGSHFTNIEAGTEAESTTAINQSWAKEPNGINVRYDVDVYGVAK